MKVHDYATSGCYGVYPVSSHVKLPPTGRIRRPNKIQWIVIILTLIGLSQWVIILM